MLRRPRPFASCARAAIPRRTKTQILTHQDGLCADCGARLDPERIVFDHRPPLALRETGDDPNDPDRLAAICLLCNRMKTGRDLVEIAKAKRLAANQASYQSRMAEKVCGRPRLTRRAERELKRHLGEGFQPRPSATTPTEARCTKRIRHDTELLVRPCSSTRAPEAG